MSISYNHTFRVLYDGLVVLVCHNVFCYHMQYHKISKHTDAQITPKLRYFQSHIHMFLRCYDNVGPTQHKTNKFSEFFLASGSDQTTDMQPWVSMHRRIKAFLKLSSAAGCVPLLCAAAAKKDFFLLLGFFLKHDAASCKLRLSLVAAPALPDKSRSLSILFTTNTFIECV